MALKIYPYRHPSQEWSRNILQASGDIGPFAEHKAAQLYDINFAVVAEDDSDDSACVGGILMLPLKREWVLLCGAYVEESLRGQRLLTKMLQCAFEHCVGLKIICASASEWSARDEIAAGMCNVSCARIPKELGIWHKLILQLLHGDPRTTLDHSRNRGRQVRINNAAYEALGRPWTRPWTQVPPYRRSPPDHPLGNHAA